MCFFLKLIIYLVSLIIFCLIFLTQPNITHRCLSPDQLFPPDKPVWCNDRTESPYIEMKCCKNELCNKDIKFNIPELGERHQDTHIISINNNTTFTLYFTHIWKFQHTYIIMYVYVSR